MVKFQAFFPKQTGFLQIVLLCLALLLAACSDSSSATQATRPGPTQAAASNQNKPAPANPNPPAATGPNAGPFDCNKVFCFGLAQEPVGLIQGNFDPANLVDRPSL